MLLNVVIGGKTKFLENGVPYVEGGEPGYMDTTDPRLTYKEYTEENDNEKVTAYEYWEGDQLRHRSIDMVLKKGLPIAAIQADMG